MKHLAPGLKSHMVIEKSVVMLVKTKLMLLGSPVGCFMHPFHTHPTLASNAKGDNEELMISFSFFGKIIMQLVSFI